MNLDEALIYSWEKQQEGHKSDGCTMAPDLGIRHFCVMHDMLRRFYPVSAAEADNLFFEAIMTKGWNYVPVAVVYWLFVRLQSKFNLDPVAMAGIGGMIILIILLINFG